MMFLALKEIRHDKIRYGLIVAMIVMVAYLLFMLTGLMNGLSRENTAAITDWQTRTVLLNQNANDTLSQSLITTNQLPPKINNQHEALVGQLPVVMKPIRSQARKQTIQFIGLKENQFIYQKRLKIVNGHRPMNNHEIILDDSLRTKGYRLGSKVNFNSTNTKYRIVGFVHNAKLNIAPIAYGRLRIWQTLRGGNFAASAIISNQGMVGTPGKGLKKYSVDEFINKLPGYAAQNSTFEFMIVFLLVISLVVIAVFLYILTMQKMKQYAILRAQGIPSKTLVWAVVAQSLILMVSGVLIATILTIITMHFLPVDVPMALDPQSMGLMGLALLILGMAGSLLPVSIITRIDPLEALK